MFPVHCSGNDLGELFVRPAVPNQVSQGDFSAAKQTDLEVSVSCYPHSIACAAKVIAHRCDEACSNISRIDT